MNEQVLVMDKTVGPSSFDVVRDVRRLMGGAKVGHAGSLDPFASGVLVLLIGKATKLSDALLTADKSYRALVKLGDATDSLDRTGTVIESLPVPSLSTEKIEEVLSGFVGEWQQVPPMYSAKKIDGVRLYKLARKNIVVPREAVPVQLYRMTLLKYEAPYLEFEVHCSKGTYIRSLAEELAKRLGTVGHLAELRRLSCGSFTLEESVTVEALRNDSAPWAEVGYRNYVRLLRSEGVFRPRPLPDRGAPQLQMTGKSANSLPN